eukprot:345010-Chlamydomonas_euryale.AAC.4
MAAAHACGAPLVRGEGHAGGARDGGAPARLHAASPGVRAAVRRDGAAARPHACAGAGCRGWRRREHVVRQTQGQGRQGRQDAGEQRKGRRHGKDARERQERRGPQEQQQARRVSGAGAAGQEGAQRRRRGQHQRGGPRRRRHALRWRRRRRPRRWAGASAGRARGAARRVCALHRHAVAHRVAHQLRVRRVPRAAAAGRHIPSDAVGATLRAGQREEVEGEHQGRSGRRAGRARRRPAARDWAVAGEPRDRHAQRGSARRGAAAVAACAQDRGRERCRGRQLAAVGGRGDGRVPAGQGVDGVDAVSGGGGEGTARQCHSRRSAGDRCSLCGTFTPAHLSLFE